MTFPSPGLDRVRRRRLVLRLALLAGLVVVLIGSALLWPRQRVDVLRVPTTGGDTSPSGVVAGRVAASRDGDLVCYSVAAPSGTALLVFPQGWAADRQLGLLDPSGTVLANRGDDVVVTGRPGALGAVPGCTGTGRVWTVSSLRTS